MSTPNRTSRWTPILATVLLVAVANIGSVVGADWQYKRKLTFDNSAQSEDLVSFPILVKLYDSRIDYSVTQDSGQDLRFFDADMTSLSHEIERWDETDTSYVWVNVTQVDGASDTDYIWMYYGNATSPDGQNASAVWSNGYAAVWHLNDDPEGGSPIRDSGPNSKHGVGSGGMDASNLMTGRVGGGLYFDGVSEYIRVPSSATDALAITGDALTLEAWERRSGDTPGSYWMAVLGRQYGTGSADSYVLALKYNDPSVGTFNTTSGGAVETPTGEFPDLEWRYMAGVQTATEVAIFSNGVEINQNPTGGDIQTDSNDVTIGGQENGADATVDTWFVGTIDEVRISNVARSADWLAAQYTSMTDALVTYGPQEIADLLSVTVNDSSFTFGTASLNSWLPAQATVIKNDGAVAEDFTAQISTLTDGANSWAISNTVNGEDSVRAQWSTTSATGPWTDVSAYASDFIIATNVAATDSITFWFRIQTPVSTSSYQEYSSVLTVTAQE